MLDRPNTGAPAIASMEITPSLFCVGNDAEKLRGSIGPFVASHLLDDRLVGEPHLALFRNARLVLRLKLQLKLMTYVLPLFLRLVCSAACTRSKVNVEDEHDLCGSFSLVWPAS